MLKDDVTELKQQRVKKVTLFWCHIAIESVYLGCC